MSTRKGWRVDTIPLKVTLTVGEGRAPRQRQMFITIYSRTVIIAADSLTTISGVHKMPSPLCRPFCLIITKTMIMVIIMIIINSNNYYNYKSSNIDNIGQLLAGNIPNKLIKYWMNGILRVGGEARHQSSPSTRNKMAELYCEGPIGIPTESSSTPRSFRRPPPPSAPFSCFAFYCI